MIHRLAWAFAALLPLVAPAAAQRWPDERCIEEPNLAPCLQSRADDLARSYGVQPIEAHRDAGDEVLRIFYVKNGDRALISLVRAPGRDPMAYVYFPRLEGGPAPPPMQAPIPQQVWDEILFRAAYADRSLVPVPPPESDSQTICLHPWNYVFEASIPATPALGIRARIRRHSINSCDDAPLLQFAADLQRLALPLFPACEALRAELFGNAVQRLERCTRLSGDRLSAAEIMNLAHAFEIMGGSETLSDLFASDAAIHWDGRRRATNDDQPAAFWRARVAEDRVNGFSIEAADGGPEGRVRLTGHLYRDQPGTNDGTVARASFEQLWVTNWSGRQVASVVVGPWEVYRPR
jgi:hypothetical protein